MATHCRNILSIVIIIAITITTFRLAAEGDFQLSSKVLDAAEIKHGPDARKRLISWQKFIQANHNLTETEKLIEVNRFFNQITFISDAIHWNKKDYWATPIEFLVSNGGDCEDFSLAKYFTLKLLGVPEDKLNLTYVKAWKLNQAHMVVTYYPTPDAEPLVLDNLIESIEPAGKRNDLLPVFSFNGSGLWVSKERGRGNLVGKSGRLKLWNNLLQRMPEGLK